MMPSVIQISKKDLPALLPARADISHKQDGGKCLIIAGSQGLWGAGLLCAQAAYRSGAGYVYLPEKTKDLILYPDFVSVDVSTKLDLSPYTSIAIGPGCVPTKDFKALFTHVVKTFSGSVVVDAGALTLIDQLPPHWIMTPHEGELSRILNLNLNVIRSDRKKAIQKAQKKFGGIVILKGSHTLIANDQNIYEILTGNKALAKAGTGDVLTGMIAGFLSQKLKPINASVLACGLHGHMADLWVKKNDYLSLMASDLIKLMPKTMLKLRH